MEKYTGKSLDAILTDIAQTKKVNKDEIIYKVLETKNGFLGIGKETTIEAYVLNDVAVYIKNYLTNHFNNLKMVVNIDVEIVKNTFKVNLDSDSNALLIGKNGKTLTAINNLVKKVIEKQFNKRYIVSVDVNNYKADKYVKLTKLAKRLAKEVLNSKASILLDPMPADERKVIHNALANFEHISTKSEGEGKHRRLRINYEE